MRKKWESLSEREREVLHWVTEGLGNKGIATHLSVSVNTVQKHLKNVFEKLEVKSRTEAIHWWVEKVLISVFEIESQRCYNHFIRYSVQIMEVIMGT